MGQLNEFEELRGILFELEEQSTLTNTYTPYQEALLKDAKALLILLRSESENLEAQNQINATLEKVTEASTKLKSTPHPSALKEAYVALNALISEQ